MRRYAIALGALSVALLSRRAAAADVDAGEPYGFLPLVDEVITGEATDPHAVFEDPPGASAITTVLGQKTRSMTPADGAKVFAYKIGKGKGLVAGKAYLLTIEYPDDAGRQMVVVNRGADQVRTYSTGQTIGDTRESYTYPSPESLKIPLTGKIETIHSLFYLHEKFQGVKSARNSEDRKMEGGPADGFWVAIGQFRKKDSPLDAGAAVTRIRLYEVPNPEKLDLAVHYPPDDLPRRHLMWREEMADGIIGAKDPAQNAFADPVAWYDAKMKTARFLGINTFTKDLLEFGYTQNWDPTPGGGNDWFYTSPLPKLWENLLDLATKRGMDVIPYYEYAGAMGNGVNGTPSYGKQRHCRPLADRANNWLSDVSWSETACIDVSDPAALVDVKKLIDSTMGIFKTKAAFAGAWFRTRSSNWPMSFADETLARFGKDQGTAAPTRDALKTDGNLLKKYYAWWFGQRRTFLLAIRDYVKQTVAPSAAVLFTPYVEESLHVPASTDVWTPVDDMAGWKTVNATLPWQYRFNPTDWSQFVSDGKYPEMITRMTPPTAQSLAAKAAENDHSAPPADPQDFKNDDDVYMAMPFSRLFTTSSAAGLDQFKSKSGLAIVRHFNLNEEDGDNPGAPEGPMSKKLGYFVSDVDREGPYSMLAEARAVANGDPRMIGYLAAQCFNRGFPEYTRAFNAAYLALPALPSTVVAGAASDAEVVVREIKTDKYGTYYAVVNTGLGSKTDVKVTLAATGNVYDLVTSKTVDRSGNAVTLALYPGQLYAFDVSTGPVPGGDGGTTPGADGGPNGNSPTDDSGGCSCSVPGESAPGSGAVFGLIVVGLLWSTRRRR
ncbi:hypothetical protein BH09MYX1_BH09MYX1_51740 [soil metagenome]